MASVHEVWGISGVGFALSVSALIASALSYVWLKRSGWLETEGEYQQGLVRESWDVVKSGAHLGVGTMLMTVLIWTDTIAVRLLRGNHAVGMYSAGNRVALALLTLAGLYVLGALPHLSHASTAEPSRFVSLFQRTYDDLALLFLPGALWTISYAPEVIHFLFKQEDYIAGVSVFRIFQVALVVNAISTLYGLGGLVAHHRDRTYQRVLLISTAVFVVLCPALTIAWGTTGAALAVLVAQVVCLVLFLFEARKVAPARHGRALLPPLALGAGAVFACRSLGLSLLPGVGMLILAYAILLVLRARSIRQEGIWRAALQQS
jgi:O-antigen/teichoic acid export membrane protein